MHRVGNFNLTQSKLAGLGLGQKVERLHLNGIITRFIMEFMNIRVGEPVQQASSKCAKATQGSGNAELGVQIGPAI